MIFSATAIETFNATSYTAMRSMSSKLVTKDELGTSKDFTLLGPGMIHSFKLESYTLAGEVTSIYRSHGPSP